MAAGDAMTDNGMSMGEYEEAYGATDFPPISPIRELGETIPWPESGCTTYANGPGGRYYRALNGAFPEPLPGVTTVLKVLGLSTNALIAWSANTERAAVLEAAADVFAEGTHDDGPAGFIAAVESRIGKARQHAKLVSKASDIGTAAHAAVQRMLRMELGLLVGPEVEMPEQSQWAFMAFEDFWRKSGLKAVRSEQLIWDDDLGYAGTIDIIADDPKRGPGIIDIKTSKGCYTDHHVQVAAYCHAARKWTDINWASIVRLPKNTSDPEFEVKELGHLYGGQTLTEPQLFEAFSGALQAWKILLGQPA
jgi:hypothetical protein